MRKPRWFFDVCDGNECLRTNDAHGYATVWQNGYWWLWDRRGVGGENGVETNVITAMHEAEKALLRRKAELEKKP